MSSEQSAGSEAAEVWPPPIPAPKLQPKPLTKGEMSLARWRWFYTLMVPFMAGCGVLRYSEHSLRGTLIFTFDVITFTAVAVRSWRLKSRLNESERGA